MQVLQAGDHKLLLLELEADHLVNAARQAGFEAQVEDRRRNVLIELSAVDRQAPLLLFDAADPGNLGWFARCAFYIDGRTGTVLQTPIVVANVRDRSGQLVHNSIKVQLAKELPAGFRLPGKQPVSEQMVYVVLYNFMNALLNVGVGVCGGPSVKPLAGRTEKGSRS
ncbi:MAG: hypothetical protein FJW40_10660 [Acidobacteria bacterium]|nr:hypothetical protein [Acidobacteriota bacterium]